MLTRLTLALCLLATACTDDYVNGRLGGKSLEKELCPTGCSGDVSRLLATGGEFDKVGENTFASVVGDEREFRDVCDVLPTDGLCANACDRDVLARQVPAGTCVAFACALTDGRDLLVGACALTPE